MFLTVHNDAEVVEAALAARRERLCDQGTARVRPGARRARGKRATNVRLGPELSSSGHLHLLWRNDNTWRVTSHDIDLP